MAIYINDLTIENDPYGRYRISYKDKVVILDRYQFNQLYDNLDHGPMYKFIVLNFFHEKPDMMYDEYFGTDSYDVERETERLKKLKAQTLEQKLDNDNRKQPSQKELNRTKLNSTFWGMLLIQDIIDASN